MFVQPAGILPFQRPRHLLMHADAPRRRQLLVQRLAEERMGETVLHDGAPRLLLQHRHLHCLVQQLGDGIFGLAEHRDERLHLLDHHHRHDAPDSTVDEGLREEDRRHGGRARADRHRCKERSAAQDATPRSTPARAAAG